MILNEKFFIVLACVSLLLLLFLQGRGKARDHKGKKLVGLKWGKRGKVHGIIFGRIKNKVLYSNVSQEQHCFVCAGTGKGKTSSLLIPTLRSWTGSSLTIDISGDISKNCPTMENKLVFEPENPDTLPYDAFNIIDKMDNKDQQNEALCQLAILLMPESPNMNDNAKFFLMNGRKILMASLITFFHQGLDFCEICRKIVSSSWQTLFNEIDEIGNEEAVMYINGFQGANEANTSGCFQQACEAISLFATNKNVINSVRRPGNGETALKPDCIEENNIFVIVQDEKLELYAPLMNIIVSQFMQYISSRVVNKGTSKTILLALDEYASLHIDSGMILEATRKYRKRFCRLMILTQNLADLIILYGQNVTRSLIGNFDYKVLLGGIGDLESLETFSKLIGYKETKKRSVSRSASGTSRTESEDKEYIIEPSELDRLGDDMILISPEGYFRLQKNFYFKK
jgi:type IV secretory pathway TraG/TraD family ATPase VirD4